MSKRKSKSTFKNVFAALLAIGLFALCALLIYVFAISPLLQDDDPTTPGSTNFSVTLEDTTYDKDSTISLYSEYTVFEVSSEEFKVEILPLKSVNFDYFVDGKAERYSEVKDMFSSFEVLYTESGFSVNPPKGDIIDVLAKYHNVDRSSIQTDGDISGIEAFFAIKISTSDSSITLTCIFGSAVTDVELSENDIVF